MVLTPARCRSILAVFIIIASFVFCDSAFAGRKLYWTDTSSNRIFRAEANTLNQTPGDASVDELVTSGQFQPLGITLDFANGKMYWVEQGDAGGTDGAIRRRNLDGTGPIEDVITGLVDPAGVALDLRPGQNKMYWTDFGENLVRRADIDDFIVMGTLALADSDEIATTGESPIAIALDVGNSKVYWADFAITDNVIRRADMEGPSTQDSEEIVTGLSQPRGIDLDVRAGEEKVYWSEWGTGAGVLDGVIRRADMNSTGQAPGDPSVDDLITSGIFSPQGLVVDTFGNQLYWADFGGQSIQRSSLTGGSFVEIVTGISGNPFGLDLEPIPELPPGAFPALGFAMSGLLLWLRRKWR